MILTLEENQALLKYASAEKLSASLYTDSFLLGVMSLCGPGEDPKEIAVPDLYSNYMSRTGKYEIGYNTELGEIFYEMAYSGELGPLSKEDSQAA